MSISVMKSSFIRASFNLKQNEFFMQGYLNSLKLSLFSLEKQIFERG